MRYSSENCHGIDRTKIPSFNDQSFSGHLPEDLIPLVRNIFFGKNRYQYIQVTQNNSL